MKDNHLLDVLGDVDPELVAEAAPKHLNKAVELSRPAQRRIRWRRWIPALAAMLVVAILAGAMLGDVPGLLFPETQTADGGHNALETEPPAVDIPASYRLSTATYPLMAKYPTEGYDREKYNAWRESVRQQELYRGAGENLDPFFEKTILQFLSGAGTENAVYSPLNVYLALAMLAETTAGESRQQILDLLECNSIEDLRTQVHAIWNANYRDDERTVSILGNSVWLDAELPYQQETLDRLAKYYYASAFQGQMGSDEYNKVLHAWMNEQTGNLLEDQINDIKMDVSTVFALVSTVYYEGGWSSPFTANDITEEIFYGALGESKCKMMHRRLTDYTYRWGDRFVAVGLSLSDGEMDFILPDEGVRVEDLLSDTQALRYIVSGDAEDRQRRVIVNLSIPQFDVESQMDLISNLKKLGITDCFEEGKADFSPLLLSSDTVVGKIQHGARVVVNEQGVKAAAYTYIEDVFISPLPEELKEVDFVVDRPFIFVLRNSDGLPLFVGVVNQVNG